MGTFILKDFILYLSIILTIQFILPKLFFQEEIYDSHSETILPAITFIFIQISYILMAPVYENCNQRCAIRITDHFLKAKFPAAILSSLIFAVLHTQYSGYKPLIILFCFINAYSSEFGQGIIIASHTTCADELYHHK